MASRIPITRRGDMLLPANQEALDAVRALPEGQDLAADVLQLRNGAMHRAAFAFVNLAYQYWSPQNHLTSIEKQTVAKLGRFLIDNGMDQEAMSTLCKTFLSHLNTARKGMEFDKDLESFREYITVEAGHCHTVITPAGPKRVAKSWAYKNMSQAAFERLFTDIRNTCWHLVLSQTFSTMEEADAVAEQLMGFD